MMNKSLVNFIATRVRPVELVLLAKFLLGIKRKDHTLNNGLKYNIDPLSNLGLTLINEKVYEPEMTSVIAEILKPGDTFVDMGSNEGYFSIYGAFLCGPSGKVYAIEPQSRLWNVIIKNQVLNDQTNIQLLPYGIGSAKTELTMNLYPELNTGASTFSSDYNFQIRFKFLRSFMYKKEKIKIITMNTLKSTLPSKIKLLKVDIEGFELEAIKGSTDLLASQTFENLLIEIHTGALKGMNQSEEELNDFIAKYGYKFRKIASNLNLYYL